MMHSTRCRMGAAAMTLALAVAGCSTIEYNHDFDPQVDFSKYKTYMWLQDADPGQQHSTGVNELLQKRFVAAIDTNLVAKGYTRTATAPADFIVHFVVTTQEKIDFNTYYAGWGYYGWYGGTQVTAQQYTEGTLVIDVFDVASKSMAWRGTATGTIDPSVAPEERNLRIQDAVAGTLRTFPPGPPKK